MKKILIITLVLWSVTAAAGKGSDKLGIGDKAVLTDVKMDEVSGETISLNDAKRENGLVVLFSCNQCPFVLRWEDRFDDIKRWADSNSIGMIVLNSNYQNRNGDDSFEAMQTKAKQKAYQFYYALDKDSRLANAIGGQTTPHAFLFDADFNLAYKGAIDDSYKSAADVKQTYLKDAIFSLGADKKIAIAETNPVGCSIKRKIE